MKNYTITVNGNVYDVTVEENGAGAVQTAAPVAAPRLLLRQLQKQLRQQVQEVSR